MTVKTAQGLIADWHRHLKKVQGGLFAACVMDGDDTIGVALAANPARVWQGTGRFVIARVAVMEGKPNACSMLYGALCRAGKALGYREAWTYTRMDEPGTSLRAAGFQEMGRHQGRRMGPREAPAKAGGKRGTETTVDEETGGMNTFGERIASDIFKLRQELVGNIEKVDALGAILSGVWPESLPCSAWDSRCTQYEILLRRASFLMQTASAHDPEMRKFIDEMERLVPPASQSIKETKP